MLILNDDDLFSEITSARILLRAVNSSMGDISGDYDDRGWFIPRDTETVCWKCCEWLEIIRSISDKLDDAYTYLDQKLTPTEYKKAANPYADQSKGLTATETTGTGCCDDYITAVVRNQEEAEKRPTRSS